MYRRPLFAVLLASASIAHAGDKVLYQPAPAWVKPAPAAAVPAGDDAPVVLVFDNQQRLADGRVWTYFDTASRVASAQALSQVGSIQLPWQPAHGDLIVHTAEILRGTERIDLLKGKDPFTVLRREQGMEQRMLDGMLTATWQVAGLQVGDVLRVAFSVTRADPTLKGEVQTVAPLVFAPQRVGFGRVRLLWPAASDVRWRSYADVGAVQPVTAGGDKELTLALPLAKPADLPEDAPPRFHKLPIVEATSFADWAAVSRAMAPLYRTNGLIAPGSPLAREAAAIKAASTDPMVRTAAALRLVQEKVRYLLLGMDTGNYVPQPPAETWASRFGDCKAKTLLLLALLHDLGVEAEPVLASIKYGDFVGDRLPGAGAFDHVLVRASVGGETLWLDGTGSGARLADLKDTPALGQVLPLRAAGASLMPIALRAPARPDATLTIDYDETAGLNLPAPFKVAMTVRGETAELMRSARAQATSEQMDDLVAKLFTDRLDSPMFASREMTVDDAAGTVTIAATGVAYPDWNRENERLRAPLGKAVTELKFAPDRARAAWSAIPVRTAPPSYILTRTTIRLPRGGAGFTIKGDADTAQRLGGRISRGR